MTTSGPQDVSDAIRRLHREKDAAYRDAWKKRGELISIMANVARKVDRLEHVVNGGPTTVDESLWDTTVDLLIYSLKHQTYLADLDSTIADMLFSNSDLDPPYSDGPAGFEHLLSQVDLSVPDAQHMTAADAARAVLARFGELEACFAGLAAAAAAPTRLTHVQALTAATVCLLATLRRDFSRTSPAL